MTGRIVVIKPRLNANESADVRQYSLEHPDEFPQQSTADQWFDEAQFESYRRLGLLSGSAAATTIKGVRLYGDLQDSREELRQSEERFRSLVQNGPDLITIVDGDGTLGHASPPVHRCRGYRPARGDGHTSPPIVPPTEVARRDPLAVVMTSVSVSLARLMRVRNSPR